MSKVISIKLLLLVIVLLALIHVHYGVHGKGMKGMGGTSRGKRMAPNHHIMLHTHMSRKVFDRACAASKDVIDEIILCVTNNKDLMKHLKFQNATVCHKEAFGTDFDPKDMAKHRDEICKSRDKFESMIGCVYEKISADATPQQMQELTEGMVDVGLCIVNALDG